MWWKLLGFNLKSEKKGATRKLITFKRKTSRFAEFFFDFLYIFFTHSLLSVTHVVIKFSDIDFLL